MSTTSLWLHRSRIALRLLSSAGMDVALAAAFLITWWAPETLGERSVHRFTFVMLIEFLVVHSTGFFGAIGARDIPRLQRAAQFFGLLLIYCALAAAFSAGYGSLWPLYTFLVLTVSKFSFTVLRPPDFDGQTVVMANWAAMTALYLMGAFATLILPIPALGVTPEVIARQEFGVGGAWPEEPYRVLAFGAIYFAGMACLAVVNEFVPWFRGGGEGEEGR